MPGRGSLFYLDLPCAVVADADEGEDRAQVESDGARGVRVAQTTEHQAGYVHLLIADDDLAVRVRSQLETWQLRWRPFMRRYRLKATRRSWRWWSIRLRCGYQKQNCSAKTSHDRRRAPWWW